MEPEGQTRLLELTFNRQPSECERGLKVFHDWSRQMCINKTEGGNEPISTRKIFMS